MAYYFMVSKKKGQYTPLDIKKTPYFTRSSKFKDFGMSLYEADMFTMMFNNEDELRNALVKHGVLENHYINKPLSIRRIEKGQYEKVMYDFLYQKDIEYIMDPNKLIRRIQDNLYNDDFLFICEYAKAFRNYRDCLTTAAEVSMFADNCVTYNNLDRHLLSRDENDDDMLTRMTKLLIYDYRQFPDGKTVYYDKIKYRHLHSIVAFINNYDRKHAPVVNTDQISMFEQVEINKPKTLKKKKKEKYIPGQISLFD